MPIWLVQLLAVARKEVRQTVRDKRMMFMLLGAPLLQLIVFGFAVDFDVDRVPTVVVDHDRTEASRTHLRRLFADGTLVRVADVPDERSAEAMLDNRGAAVVLVVPARFAADLARGRSAPVQVVIDGTDANRGSVAANAVARYFQQVALELAAAHGRVPVRPRTMPRVLYNPSLRTPPYIVPGIAAMILLIITTVVMAMGLAREREMGTLEQVLVTPLSPRVLMLGKLLPFVLIGLVDFGVALVAGSYVFGMPLRGGVLVPVVATLHDLDRASLVSILREPKNSLIKQYQTLLDFENVSLRFTDDALESIADEAITRNVGARGLKIILEELMLDVMYRVPSEEEIEECVVTKDAVLRHSSPILSLRKAG